jgi:hypothetical protein
MHADIFFAFSLSVGLLVNSPKPSPSVSSFFFFTGIYYFMSPESGTHIVTLGVVKDR